MHPLELFLDCINFLQHAGAFLLQVYPSLLGAALGCGKFAAYNCKQRFSWPCLPRFVFHQPPYPLMGKEMIFSAFNYRKWPKCATLAALTPCYPGNIYSLSGPITWTPMSCTAPAAVTSSSSKRSECSLMSSSISSWGCRFDPRLSVALADRTNGLPTDGFQLRAGSSLGSGGGSRSIAPVRISESSTIRI